MRLLPLLLASTLLSGCGDEPHKRFSHDNATLLTGLPAASIALWRVQDGAELKLWTAPRDTLWRATRPAATAVSFSDRTRSVIAAMSDGSVMIWGM